MEISAAQIFGRAARKTRARIRAEKLETALIVVLAGLVLFKGAPVTVAITLCVGEMLMDLMRLMPL